MKEIKEITGMRGIAAQSVIFFHFCAISPVLQSIVISGIGLPLSWNNGVDFFFVLSGFLLSIPFMRMETKVSLRQYYLKRALRIFPAYYVSLLFITLFFSNHVTWQDILASALYSQNFFRSTFTSINGVYWTLTIEETFYATLPLFALLFVRGRWIFSLPGCVALSTGYREVIFSLYKNNLGSLNFYLWQYPSYIEHYALGATLAALFVSGKFVPRRINSMFLAIILGALVSTEYLLGKAYASNAYDYPISNLLFALEFAGLIYFTLALPIGSRGRNLFTNKITTVMGKLSYSTYVWHLPVLFTLYTYHLPLLEWMAYSYLVTMGLATLTYFVVERPFLKLKDRLAFSKATAAFGSTEKTLEKPPIPKVPTQENQAKKDASLSFEFAPAIKDLSFLENPR